MDYNSGCIKMGDTIDVSLPMIRGKRTQLGVAEGYNRGARMISENW
jgi:hypothetical protein